MNSAIVIISVGAMIAAAIEFFVLARREAGHKARLNCTREPARYDNVPY